MANNENTRAPAGGSEEVCTLTAQDAAFLAARLRRLFAHFGYALPGFADGVAGSDASLIRIAGSCIGGLLASAPASAPLPLTDQRILDLVTENAEGSGWLSKPGCWGALNRFARAIERECLAAAPVADERAEFETAMARAGYELNPQRYWDGPYRSREYEAGWAAWQARAALSGGSPEPVSGSEGEEEGGKS